MCVHDKNENTDNVKYELLSIRKNDSYNFAIETFNEILNKTASAF